MKNPFNSLVSIESLLARRLPVQRSGIYFLFDRDELVYIGQGKLAAARAADHLRILPKKKFDSYAFVPCPPRLLNSMEVRYIYKFRPRYNNIRSIRCKKTKKICEKFKP